MQIAFVVSCFMEVCAGFVTVKGGGCKFVQSMVILDVINHVKPGNM